MEYKDNTNLKIVLDTPQALIAFKHSGKKNTSCFLFACYLCIKPKKQITNSRLLNAAKKSGQQRKRLNWHMIITLNQTTAIKMHKTYRKKRMKYS